MIIIRKANAADLVSIFQFEKSYMAEIEKPDDQINILWLNANTSIGICRELAYHLPRTYVAEEKGSGKLAGHSYWSIGENGGGTHVFSIYVMKEWRGQGVERKLLTEVENDMKESGFDVTHLQMNDRNRRVQKTFKPSGYQEQKQQSATKRGSCYLRKIDSFGCEEICPRVMMMMINTPQDCKQMISKSA